MDDDEEEEEEYDDDEMVIAVTGAETNHVEAVLQSTGNLSQQLLTLRELCLIKLDTNG